MEVIEMKKNENEGFFRKVKRTISEKWKETKVQIAIFALEHPEVSIPLCTGLGSFAAGSVAAFSKGRTKRYELRKVHDETTDQYFLVKHPLRNDEILELGEEMENNNKSKGRALKDMGLLTKERRRRK